VLCDTTYSDPAAPDGRGRAAAAIEIEMARPRPKATATANGTSYPPTEHPIHQRTILSTNGQSSLPTDHPLEHRQAVSSRLRVHGTLSDGAAFDFTMPARPVGAAVGAADGEGQIGDPFVGRLTPDGLWVKALRCDGLYHLSAAKPGGRGVVYSQATRAAVERALTVASAYD
jgi:hypothetical protein